MARIRTVKPEFWTSEQVISLSRDARLLFIGLWNFCDDGGNHPASYITVKAEVFPADSIDIPAIRRMIDELLSNDLLILYESDGKQYWHVNGWHHQKIDRPSYKHPKYTDSQRVTRDSTNIRRMIDDHSPPEGKGKEGSEIGKESSVVNARAISEFQKVFDAGCQLFPRIITSDSSPIHAWLNGGCDIELDILPTLQRSIGKDIGTWGYFTKAIVNTKANRTQPLPKGTPYASNGFNQQLSKSDRAKAAALAGYEQYRRGLENG